MKRIGRRAAASLLAVVMCMALAVPAFAASPVIRVAVEGPAWDVETEDVVGGVDDFGPTAALRSWGAKNAKGLTWNPTTKKWKTKSGKGWLDGHLLPSFTRTAESMGPLKFTGYALRSGVFIGVPENTVMNWHMNSRYKGQDFSTIWKKSVYNSSTKQGIEIVNQVNRDPFMNVMMYNNGKDTGVGAADMYGARRIKVTKATDTSLNGLKYGLDGRASIRELTYLENGNTPHKLYAYCIQMGLEDKVGTEYAIKNIDGSGYLTEDAQAHIQWIIENGYWGREDNGQKGSLSAVRALVGGDSNVSNGIALAVTQAALWYYGAGDAVIPYDCSFEFCWQKVTSNYRYGQIGRLDAGEQTAAKNLFNALVRKGETIQPAEIEESTDVISSEDLGGPFLNATGWSDFDSFNAQLDDADKLGADDGRKYFWADVSVTVDVDPARVNSDDLAVAVLVDGRQVATVPFTADTIDEDGKVVLTARNVILPKDVDVEVELTGTQKLKSGGYLFRANSGYGQSQTLAGYVPAKDTSSYSVKLKARLPFHVNEEELGGFELPATGGTGIGLYIALGTGAVMIGGACLVHDWRRRRYSR